MRETKAETPGGRNWRTNQGGVLFTGFFSIAFPCLFVFFIKTQDPLCKGGTAHSELGPPALITNQENTLQTCLQGNLLCSNQVTLFVSRHPIV